jgi:hypothetical protein
VLTHPHPPRPRHLPLVLVLQLLLVVGWQSLGSVSHACSMRDTSGCLRGWPLIPIQPNVHKYYNLELGWYLHLMLKHPLGEQTGSLALLAAARAHSGSSTGCHHVLTLPACMLLPILLLQAWGCRTRSRCTATIWPPSR